MSFTLAMSLLLMFLGIFASTLFRNIISHDQTTIKNGVQLFFITAIISIFKTMAVYYGILLGIEILMDVLSNQELTNAVNVLLSNQSQHVILQ